jgi:glycosyltransferase involved in cell wall biosynthesis
MKIIHICNCLRGGGIQNFLLSLLPEQSKQNHQVTLIVIEKYDYEYCEHLESILIQHNVNVIRLNKIRSNKISMLKTIIRCRNIVRKINPDIVNTHGEMSHEYGAIAVLAQRIKQIITVHNAPEVWSVPLKILCKHKPLIFCSQAAYKMRTQHGNLMIPIDNGISREIIHSNKIVDLRKELGLKDTDKIIISVGSLRPQKNYTFIKHIIDEMKDDTLHFCICGGNYGPGYINTDEFKNYPNIHCLGLRSDISAIENGADLFLSCATFEGLPIAVLEAYFNGIPCVLSPIPQHKNISNIYKVLIPENFNASSFSTSIKKALENNEHHDSIYKTRIPQIEQFSIVRTCKEYISFYHKALTCK